MPLPLPNLDDRRWVDLVDESRSLIPVYAPEWTDHNPSDPGITLIEFLAWLAEGDIYRLNRIGDRQLLRMLALAGVRPKGPEPARALLRFETANVNPVQVPSGSVCSTADGIRYRTLAPVAVASTGVNAAFLHEAGAPKPVPLALDGTKAPAVFGEVPRVGNTFILGLWSTVPVGTELSLGFHFAGPRTGLDERRRILDETPGGALPEHHGVRLTWECLGSSWTPLQVHDGTRSLTLDGVVRFAVPVEFQSTVLGSLVPMYFIRCRIESGSFDSPPRLLDVFVNAAEADQAIPVATEPFLVGTGDGGPFQRVVLAGAPVVEDSVEISTPEQWQRVDDLISALPADRRYLLNPTTGDITFGDGNQGSAPAQGVPINALYTATRGAAGKTSRHTITVVGDEPLAQQVTVDNPRPSQGGGDAETVRTAVGRARQLREASLRAVTVADIERIALETPGAVVARASARPNTYPGLGCVNALGAITVTVVPPAGGPRPMPSAGLLRLVAARLNRRRLIGTRLFVIGPAYVSIQVQAKVKAHPGYAAGALAARVASALNAFFHPLTGGPDGTGWPFGRDVYRSEVLGLIDGVAGVDSVVSLAISAGGCDPQCGNICLPANALVAALDHAIEVIA